MKIADLFAKLRIQPDSKSFDAADKLIAGVTMALGALAAAAGVNFFAGMITSTVEAGGKLNDLSVQTNTNVEDLQALGFAAKQNGSSLEEMGGILTKLGKNAYDAANGNKSLAEAFHKAGISVKEASGELRPAADILGDVADHIAALPEAERAGAAMELLGKSGARLIPTLAAGSEGLEAMKQEARDLGDVMSAETVAALDDFGDEQDKVKASLNGLKNTVVAELLPALKEMVGDFLKWIKANRQIIAQKLKFVLEGIISALKVMASVVSKVVSVVEFLSNHIEILIVGVTALTATMLLFKAASVGAALASAAAWLLAALPIAIVAIGLFAIILILQDLYSWLNGGDSVLKDFFGLFKEYIGEKLTWLWDNTIGYLRAKFTEFIEWVVEKLEWIWDKIKAVGNAIGDFLDAGPGGDLRIMAERAQQAETMGLSESQRETFINTGQAPTPDVFLPSSEAIGPTTNTVAITVNSPSADPVAVAQNVKKVFDEQMASTLRSARAGVGGK